MSRFPKSFWAAICAVASVAYGTSIVQAEGLGALGRLATPAEVAAWDNDVRPDGAGLPTGRGDVETGETLFSGQCASCHGDFGEAVGRWPVLAGGIGTLDSQDPVKTVGSYWPYLSTVFDYVNRAMPFGNARSLEPDQVYAITAYILYVNDLVDDDFELSHENFAQTRLPNEDNFFLDDRANVELALFSTPVCMRDCKTDVAITRRAAVVDVTPDDENSRKQRQETPNEKPAEQQQASLAVETTETVAKPDPELVKAGQKVFKKCKACHQIGENAKNRTGPQLNALIGRPVGGLEGYRYSSAFQKANDAGQVWDEESLAIFLTNPKKAIKGTKMAFAGLRKEKDIKAILAYLAQDSQ